jgi:hypothetical protein
LRISPDLDLSTSPGIENPEVSVVLLCIRARL